MSDAVIKIQNLFKSFGKNAIFDDASLSIIEGCAFGLVGLNGSGKTTLIRLLLGLLRPNRGSINVLGFDPWRHRAEYFRRLGVILDHDGFAGNLTVAQNLKVFSAAKRMEWRHVEAYVNEFWRDTFIEDEFRNGKKKVKLLSRGQKVQCAICRAFLSWPAVYFLDEPLVALDVDASDHFYRLVKLAKEKGGTVLISSHQLQAIEDLCDTVGMLHNKRIDILKSHDEAAMPKPWFVRCAQGQNFGSVIEDICRFHPEYDNGAWRFSVVDPPAVVPKIVSALVAEGCEIQEVGPEPDDLKDRIRDHYRETRK
ncbi:MAG TPA: ABC transporter ATP-binding protein [Chitinivibrionales bacterium]|nr:ABC transporter ATP-binding protein [Chitinivibrionales bacterium]